MFFNPLFLQVINNPESINSAKSQKLNGASYLFSDIIKVAFEKTESEGLTGTTVSESASAGFGSFGGFDASAFLNEITTGSGQTENALYQLLGEVVPGSFKLGDLSGSKGIVGLPLVNNNDSKSIVLSESEVASMVAKFLDGNFHGKVNVLSGNNNQKKINIKSFDVADNKDFSSADLFELLKDGNAVSLESSDAQNTKGLLITLFKVTSAETSGLPGTLTENTPESETAETEKEISAAPAELLPDSGSAPSDKLYRMEITLIDKTGYQELSSLTLSKPAAPQAAELFKSDTAQDTPEPVDMSANQASKIFRIDNGLNGPADMSAFTGVMEDAAEASAASPLNLKSETQKDAPETAAVEVKQNDIPVSKTVPGMVNESQKVTKENKVEGPKGLTADVKTENKQAASEIKIAGDSPNSTKQPLKEISDPSAPKTAEQSADKKTVNPKAEASNAAAAVPDSGRPADSITAAAHENSGAASRINRSGILKNVNLTLKSSRTSKEINPETETADNNTVLQKQADKNLNDVSELSLENNTGIPAKDLKELNKNISDRIFAKQMHEAGSPAKENDARPVSAPAEKNENQAAQNQETSAAPGNSEGAENEMAANTSEQQSRHQNNEHNTGNNDVRFTSEINKAADNIVREKTAGESSQSNLPHKLVKAADVIKEISGFIEKNEGHSLTIKIDPESLGTVKIALDMVDKLVHANIEVENEAAKKMMENNLSQLQHSLAQSGIQLNSLNISLANQDSRQNKNSASRKRMLNNELESDFDQESVKEAKQMGYNTYEYTI